MKQVRVHFGTGALPSADPRQVRLGEGAIEARVCATRGCSARTYSEHTVCARCYEEMLALSVEGSRGAEGDQRASGLQDGQDGCVTTPLSTTRTLIWFLVFFGFQAAVGIWMLFAK